MLLFFGETTAGFPWPRALGLAIGAWANADLTVISLPGTVSATFATDPSDWLETAPCAGYNLLLTWLRERLF